MREIVPCSKLTLHLGMNSGFFIKIWETFSSNELLFFVLEAGFPCRMRNIRARDLCLAHSKEKKNLAFYVKGGVVKHFRHMI